MATFFGEVIFSTSRACHADPFGFYDEDEEEDETNELQMKKFEIEMNLKEEKLKINSVVISSGLLANEFLQGCLKCNDYKEIGMIIVKKNGNDGVETVDFRPRILKPSPLYLSSKGTLICCCSEDISSDLSTDFANQILSLVNVTCPILVLSTHHISKLAEVNDDSRCISYCLQSPTFTPPTDSFELLPATFIMTASIIEDRPCLICSTYVETFSPGNVDLVAGGFEKVINLAPFSGSLCYDEKVVIQQNNKREFYIDICSSSIFI
ncbi:hypothetical protein Avbf_15704 [Armadillidium vulgare]|nr:hypothetical protein Avbf_15704 [Armadillidium vulgare]